jgi:hypothetical protein
VTTFLPLLLACTTDTLSEAWRIDRLRVLAVAAEPAEPRPGDVVTFSALTVAPMEPGWAFSVWVACLDGAQDGGCAVDPALVEEVFADGEVESDEQQTLIEAGLIGVEPFLQPSWTVPSDALDGLDETERREGRTAFVNVSAFPNGEDLATEDAELAYKRVPISEAPTPNRNPVLEGVRVDGVLLPDGASVVLDADQTYTVEPVLADGAIEDYRYVTADGAQETRTEEPYVSLYAEEGSFDQTNALWPDVLRRYTTPTTPAGAASRLWFVVRDRRGGMSWTSITATWR